MTHNTTQRVESKPSALDVADYFLALANKSGEPITNLKLQKLVYYAQAWHLANYGTPIFDEDFEAWVHGPVVKSLYNEFKQFSYRPIDKDVELEEVESRFDSDVSEFLHEVAAVYLTHSAYELEKMTHLESPWIQARGGIAPAERSESVISKESMAQFYGERIKA